MFIPTVPEWVCPHSRKNPFPRTGLFHRVRNRWYIYEVLWLPVFTFILYQVHRFVFCSFGFTFIVFFFFFLSLVWFEWFIQWLVFTRSNEWFPIYENPLRYLFILFWVVTWMLFICSVFISVREYVLFIIIFVDSSSIKVCYILNTMSIITLCPQ